MVRNDIYESCTILDTKQADSQRNVAVELSFQQLSQSQHKKHASRQSPSNSALVLDRNLSAQVRACAVVVVTEGVALGAFGGEDQELVVGDIQTELFADVVVVLRGLVTGTAGAMEASACVDAGGGNVAVVLAGERVAGSALGGNTGGEDEGGGGEEERGEDGEVLHLGGCCRGCLKGSSEGIEEWLVGWKSVLMLALSERYLDA